MAKLIKEIDLTKEITEDILGNLSLKDVMQASVDNIVEKFKLLGGLILLVEDDLLRLKSISSNRRSIRFVKYLGVPITSLLIKLKEGTQNYIVECVLKKRIMVSHDLYHFTKGVLTRTITRTAEAITGTKSNIVLPLLFRGNSIGALYLASNKDTDFSDLIDEFEKVARLLSIAIINARNFEELNEALRQEKDMQDILAHELRTPLTVVKSGLDYLERKFTKGDFDIKEVQNVIYLAKVNMKKEVDLLESILSSATLDNKKLVLDIAPVSANNILKSAYEDFKSEAELKKITLEVRYLGSDILVSADRIRLQQVIDNLTSNAIKYTDSGSVTIGARSYKDVIEFYVKDTGRGIPSKNIPNLGRKFYRIENQDGSGKGRQKGTGIGLYVAFEFVKKMNGTILVTSKVGKGSTFSVEIPMAK
jgi:signal transduction histidine kinase